MKKLITVVFLLLLATSVAAQIVVTQPNGATARTAAGSDYSTEVRDNPWDMVDADDIYLGESNGLAGQAFVGGRYSATTTSSDPWLWILFPGLLNAVHVNDDFDTPVDTAKYNQMALKVRIGGVPGPHLLQLFFHGDALQLPSVSGFTNFISVPEDEWTVIHIDLPNATHPDSNNSWTDFPLVYGLRIDPTTRNGASVEIDWIRLTQTPTAQQMLNVAWTDSGSGPYSVAAIDSDGVSSVLAEGVVGTSTAADASQLPPGDYTIEVSRPGASGSSVAPARINDPPRLRFTEPDIRGDQMAGFGWGPPLVATDVTLVSNFVNVSFDQDGFYGRPTNIDPFMVFDAGGGIDTTVYRRLCYTMRVFGTRDIGRGWVARVLWGSETPLTTSEDIVVNEGLTEYCLGEISEIPIDPDSPSQATWAGVQNFVRLDPREGRGTDLCQSSPSPEECWDVRVESFILAPIDRADPTYGIEWVDSDSDDDAGIDLYLDVDRNPQNANQILLANALSEDSATDEFVVNATGISPGEYYVLAEISDGLNSIYRYADGPLEIAAGLTDTIFEDGFEPPAVAKQVSPLETSQSTSRR